MSALGSPCIRKESLAKGVFSFMKKPLQIYRLLYATNGALEIAKIKPAAAKPHEINATTMCHSVARTLEQNSCAFPLLGDSQEGVSNSRRFKRAVQCGVDFS